MPSLSVAVEAGTDLLARARQIQRSWDRLLGEGALGPELPPQATAGMRPMIVDSWRRVLATGLEPIDVLPSIEADPAETRERWLEHPLGLLRHVLVESLQMLAVESNSVVQVTDPSGLTLYLGGPERLKARAAEMNLVEGARCSEAVNGTNGVGTALATDRPVQVFAFEHFSQHHREWVCSGAPIHDRVSGRLVGVIDLSSPWRIAHPRSLELVTSAARTTEQCLLEGRRDNDARLKRRYGDLATKSSDLLVNREGYRLIGDDLAHPKPLDVPKDGGEIAMGDGSLAVAEPLGRGEAYLVRRPGPRRARAARGESLERAEERARELAGKRAAPSRPRDPERAGEVESGLSNARAGEHLSAYLDAAIDCVIVADASGRIVEFNPASERTFGYSRGEALGRTMAELIVPPSLRERHTAAFARFVKTRDGSMLGHRVELTGMRADGSEFPVELALSQVEAEPVLICGALRDISATKQAESHLRELADEQAALRQVATLVAYESSPERLVAVVVEQAARVFDVPLVRLIRYEPTAAVVVGGFSESVDEPFPIGSRWQLDTPGLLATIRHTGRAARVEDYALAPGDGAGAVRAAGMRSAVGSPIVVEGRVWGAIVLLSPRSASLPEDTGARLADFTDLVATALANAESRAALSRLADEQAALRRVATLVARAPASEQLFSTVASEVASVLDVPGVIVTRYEADGLALTLGAAFRPDLAGAERFLGVGARMPRDPGSLAAQVFDTHGPARIDDFSTLPGAVGDLARASRLGSGCAGPIVVNGAVWGKMCVFSRVGAVLPAGTEDRLHDFIELVATAIANHEARAELAASEAHARELADEQAALRRVATLVAEGAKTEAVFSAVAQEVAHVFDVQHVTVCLYEPDSIVILSSFEAPEPAAAPPPFPAGRRLPLDVPSLPASVYRTGEPMRIDDFNASDGLYAVASQAGLTAAIGVPIVVDGTVWGAVNIASTKDERFRPDAEERLARFTELVATSVSNATMREELAASEARARELADEQAALRRVATLVARGVSPEKIFSAVTNEMGRLFDSSQAYVGRFEPDGSAMVVVGVSDGIRGISTGSRWELEDYMASTRVYRTGRHARIERSDFEHVSGPMADLLREIGAASSVGAPIVVEGQQWGCVTVTDTSERLPVNAEKRLEKFAELLGTAIANADSRAELAASRARIIAAGDDARRRIERDLHDGAQQQLVTLAVALRRAEAKLPDGLDEQRAEVTRVIEGLATAIGDLRELSRGIHPSILTEGGLPPALKALGRRSSIRVKLDIGFEHRLPDQVEAAAYYTVAEALTNASKHSDADCIWISLRLEDDLLHLSIRDDGAGGADASRGTGLTGLTDRLEALGGTIEIESPLGVGTRIESEIPVADTTERSAKPSEPRWPVPLPSSSR
jgi:PAS domain S-box-containing protein